MRRLPGFTLIELLVALAIGSIVVLAAAAVSVSVVRANYGIEDAQSVTTRMGVARNAVERTLQSTGHLWSVDRGGTGTFGPAYCSPSTGACSAGELITPLWIVNSTTGPDELHAIVPRDSDEAVAIRAESGGSSLPNGCSNGIAEPYVLRVQGETTSDWGATDLVVVAKGGHVTLTTMGAAFGAGGAPVAGVFPDRDFFSLNLGSESDMDFDDGIAGGTCDILTSLLGAAVYRARIVRYRVNNRRLQVATATNAAQASTPSFNDVINNVDDLQLQLILAETPSQPVAAGSTVCFCNDDGGSPGAPTGVLAGTTAPSACGCSAGQLRIPDASNSGAAVIGVHVGLIVSGRRDVRDQVAFTGLFDRTGVIGTDRKDHKKFTWSVGLLNATNF